MRTFPPYEMVGQIFADEPKVTSHAVGSDKFCLTKVSPSKLSNIYFNALGSGKGFNFYIYV